MIKYKNKIKNIKMIKTKQANESINQNIKIWCFTLTQWDLQWLTSLIYHLLNTLFVLPWTWTENPCFTETETLNSAYFVINFGLNCADNSLIPISWNSPKPIFKKKILRFRRGIYLLKSRFESVRLNSAQESLVHSGSVKKKLDTWMWLSSLY